MSKTEFTRPNALGDLRAEADHRMLSQTFLETADYRTLIETSDRTLVVGRRGTGKSALSINLEKYWRKSDTVHVINISPEEYQTISLRPQFRLFGDGFNLIRAGSRIAWRYALLMETADVLSRTYKFSNSDEFGKIDAKTRAWRTMGSDIIDRTAALLRTTLDTDVNPEERIGRLPVALDLKATENAIIGACERTNASVILLIDRLDEGYLPDDTGIGLIDGLLQAAIDLKTRISSVKPVVFLRDNIFRAVQKLDPDYSRNIEGHTLRLHWDEDALFTFTAKRLRAAFRIEQEANNKVWNQCAASELRGRAGFVHCLQHTLYRPRDVLSLLNEAFYLAGKDGQHEIVGVHVEKAGRLISQNRLDDLIKEYNKIVPSLGSFISAFRGSNPELRISDAYEILQRVLDKGSEKPIVQQDFFILADAEAVLRSLYSVGFFGVRDDSSGNFIFCHDGRDPEREFTSVDSVLIHPCYWMAMNCSQRDIGSTHADEIYDEYDIEVSSETPAVRNAKIQALIDELAEISSGAQDASAFEAWCQKVIRICFVKGLRNVELKPNKLAKSRRDVVATNLGDGSAWRRIYDDYGTRQVTFEVKNYEDLQSADYQQVSSYLGDDYGRLAFFVTRGQSVDLHAKADVEWVRELWSTHKYVVIKLTAKFLVHLLEKLRNPQKHDAVNNAVHRLLDTYTRLYRVGQTSSASHRPGRRARRRSKNDG